LAALIALASPSLATIFNTPSKMNADWCDHLPKHNNRRARKSLVIEQFVREIKDDQRNSRTSDESHGMQS
jgi:hypothetical protein